MQQYMQFSTQWHLNFLLVKRHQSAIRGSYSNILLQVLQENAGFKKLKTAYRKWDRSILRTQSVHVYLIGISIDCEILL